MDNKLGNSQVVKLLILLISIHLNAMETFRVINGVNITVYYMRKYIHLNFGI